MERNLAHLVLASRTPLLAPAISPAYFHCAGGP